MLPIFELNCLSVAGLPQSQTSQRYASPNTATALPAHCCDLTLAIYRYFATIKSVPQVQELFEVVEQVRSEDEGCLFLEFSVKDTILHSAVWATTSMQKNLKEYGEVVLLEPTYLTNNLRLPFAFFLAVGGDGATLVVAACILANETIQTLDWVFSTLHSICQHRIPKVLH